MLVEGIDRTDDGPTAIGASSSRPRSPTGSRRSSASAPTTSCGSRPSRARAAARTRACGRSGARATRSSSTGVSVLPLDVWDAVEIGRRVRDGPVPGDPHRARGRPAAAARRLRARVVGAARRACATTCGPRCSRRPASSPTSSSCPNDALLRLGPPHKIPRVSRRDDATSSRSGPSGRYDDARRPARRRGGSRTTRSTATSAPRPTVLTELGVAGQAACCGARCSSEAGQFWPYVCGTVLAGARLSCADATDGEAHARRDVPAADASTTRCSA